MKNNILSNYASQIYITLIGIVTVPMYVNYMGAEAYGLVGIFAMLQAWFTLLDMGLTPTIARESARFNSGSTTIMEYRMLARALEGLFILIAFLGGSLLYLLVKPMAINWLNASEFPVDELLNSLQIIVLIVILRWMCGLYRGVISGAEHLVWLSGFNTLIATARYLLILPVLMFVSASPIAFFSFHLGVAGLELAGLAYMAYRLLPQTPKGERIAWQWAPLKPVIKFSLSIAFTSSVWVLVTQIDKLILSKILPLAEYGYFTVAVLVASGIMMVSLPISSAIMPRMARLHAEGNDAQFLAVYRQATQLVTVIVLPAALVLALFSKQVLWAWTGNLDLADRAAPTLSLYASGYGFLVVGAFPYYLQYAKGNLRLHLIGNLLFVIFLIPSVIWAASHHGATGAGWAWFVANAAYFFCWTPLVHQKYAPNIHWHWLFTDIGRIVLPMIMASLVFSRFITIENSRLVLISKIFFIGFVMLALGYSMSSRLRSLNRKKALA